VPCHSADTCPAEVLRHRNAANSQQRMFAEQISGTGPGGQSGSAMLQLQTMAEGGGVHTANIDASRFM
jgi:hypothetical protein